MISNFSLLGLSERDMVPLATTFFCCLFMGLEWGFLVGVVVNLIMVLMYAANPGVSITKFRVRTLNTHSALASEIRDGSTISNPLLAMGGTEEAEPPCFDYWDNFGRITVR
jgi:MFS superfamily sulfate permease-like transporter